MPILYFKHKKCHVNVETNRSLEAFRITVNSESGVESDDKKIVQDYDFNCCITQLKWQNAMQTIYSVSSTSDISLTT